MAARNGILAARLAAGGATGASHAFEGAAGFARAFAGESDLRLGDLNLGERWRIMDVVYKPYPVCNITQSAVAVCSGLATSFDIAPSQIRAVRCYLNSADFSYPGTVNEGPYADVGATLMSAHFCVAMALRKRTATLRGLSELNDPEQLSLIARIEVLPDDGTYNWSWEQTSGYVDALRVEMANGGVGAATLLRTLGNLENLSTIDELVEATVTT